MKICLRLGLAASLVLTAALHLSGQSYQNFAGEYDRILKSARLRLGPFRFLPKFELKSLGYDDNIYFESEGRIATDYTATLSPAVEIYWPFRQRFIAWFRENPEYVFYLRESRYRGWTNSWAAGVRSLLFSRFVLSWEYQSSEYRRQVSSELPVPAKDRMRGWKANLFYETARQTYFGFSYGVRSIAFEDIVLFDEALALSSVFDREERSANVEFYYRLFGESHFFLTVGRESYRFRHDQGASRDSASTILRGGFRFPLIGPVRGRLSLGFRRFDFDVAGRSSFSGLVGDTGLEANVGRWGFRVLYGRDLVFSYSADILYYIDQNFGPGAYFYLTNFLRIGYNLNIGWAKYPQSGTASAVGSSPSQGRQDRRFVQSAEIALRVYRTFGIGISVSSMRWNSDVAGFQRGRTFVGLNLISKF